MLHAYLTDKGRIRPGNEDALGVDVERGLFVIADGMGGHERGEVASRLAVETALHILSHDLGVPPGIDERLQLLRSAAVQAHRRVLAENNAAEGSTAMGTTLIIAQIVEDTLLFAHVGDSRLLRISCEGAVDRLTRDQTLAQKLLDEGTPARDIERRQHATLLQAIGLKGHLVPSTGTCVVNDGDTFLLCTDGLSDLVAEEQVAELVLDNGDDIDAGAEALVRQANICGGADNITVILVRPSGRRDSIAPE